MLPQSHVAYTFAAFNLARRRIPALGKVDYRAVALAAMGSDIVDKPLAFAYFYRRYRSAVLFAHTLIAYLLAVVVGVFNPWLWPYVLAFIGHAVVDRLWWFEETFYWPFRGWRFHTWQKAGSEQVDIKKAYWYAFTRRPELWIWEIGGLIAGAWFVLDNRLYRKENLWRFLLTGMLPEGDD